MRGGFGCSPCCGPPECPAFSFTAVDYDTATNQTFFAQSFIVPSGGLTLTSATLNIAGYEPLQSTLPPGSYVNYPRSRLYANEDGTGNNLNAVRPNANWLADLTAPDVASLDNPNWTFTHAGYSLTAGSRHWISLELNGEWNYYNGPVTPPFVGLPDGLCEHPGQSFTTTSGAVWVFVIQYTGTPYLLTIN